MQFVPWLVGLDVGKTTDPSALAIAELQWQEYPYYAAMQYATRHLERVPLGTAYPKMVALVQSRIEALPLPREWRQAGMHHMQQHWRLVVDATGVGEAVVDLFRQAHLTPIAVKLTHGHHVVRHSWHEFTVPKRELIGALQVTLQARRFVVAEGLAEAQTLVKEAQNYQYKISEQANDLYGAWRTGTHDDLLFAAALTAWYGERQWAPVSRRFGEQQQRYATASGSPLQARGRR